MPTSIRKVGHLYLSMNLFQKLLNAVTVTTTSDGVSLSNHESVSIQITAASISAGNGVFTVEGSSDGGANWVALSNIIDNSTAPGTRVASKTLSSNTSALLWLDNTALPLMVRVKVTVTTDGAYTATIVARKKVN